MAERIGHRADCEGDWRRNSWRPWKEMAQAVIPGGTRRGISATTATPLARVRPVATFNVSSQTNSTVIAVHYAEGQTLHRGDPCLRTWSAQCLATFGAASQIRGLRLFRR